MQITAIAFIMSAVSLIYYVFLSDENKVLYIYVMFCLLIRIRPGICVCSYLSFGFTLVESKKKIPIVNKSGTY